MNSLRFELGLGRRKRSRADSAQEAKEKHTHTEWNWSWKLFSVFPGRWVMVGKWGKRLGEIIFSQGRRITSKSIDHTARG